jgi:hypothetical protein
MKTRTILILILFITGMGLGFLYSKNSVEIERQNLLTCHQLYEAKRDALEAERYGEHKQVGAMIWSSKTKSCLAYYNLPQESLDDHLFEVWDYSNDKLVLKYDSHESGSIDLLESFEKAMQDLGFKK